MITPRATSPISNSEKVMKTAQSTTRRGSVSGANFEVLVGLVSGSFTA
jgi:hypothetical protein